MNLGTSGHIKSNEETRFSLDLGLYGIQMGLNSQTKVLGVRELEDVTDADEGSLAGEEGLRSL